MITLVLTGNFCEPGRCGLSTHPQNFLAEILTIALAEKPKGASPPADALQIP